MRFSVDRYSSDLGQKDDVRVDDLGGIGSKISTLLDLTIPFAKGAFTMGFSDMDQQVTAR